MSVDIARLRQVLEHITANPETHDQNWWAVRTDCGTVACIAGHTVLLAGLPIDFDTEDEFGNVGNKLLDRRRIEDVAADLLGLDRQQRFHLFHALDLAECWAAASSITGKRVRWRASDRGPLPIHQSTK